MQASGVDWTFIEFCPLGFIGKLFVTTEIPDFIQYISVFYNDWPCDWLLATYTRTRACPLNMSMKVHMKKCWVEPEMHRPKVDNVLFWRATRCGFAKNCSKMPKTTVK